MAAFSAWDKIAVPSNWELQGYGTPIYIDSPSEWPPDTGGKTPSGQGGPVPPFDYQQLTN